MMKLLFLTYEKNNGGGNFSRSFHLAKSLVETHNHSVTLICASRQIGLSKITKESGVSIIETPDILPEKIRSDGLSLFDILYRLGFPYRDYDLIHTFGHRPSVSVPFLVRRNLLKTKVIFDWCDLWGKGGLADYRKSVFSKLLGWGDSLTEKQVYKQALAMTVISSDLFSKTRDLGLPTEKILLLPPGSDIYLLSHAEKIKIKKKYKIPLAKKIVIYAGAAQHDIELLLGVINKLAGVPHVHIVYVGQLDRKRFQISSKCTYIPFVEISELKKILTIGDIALLPYPPTSINISRYPNKIGDYLGAGVPVITNPTGDLPLHFRNTSAVIFTESQIDEMCTTAIQVLFDKHLDERKKNAIKTAKAFSWSERANTLNNFYLRIVKK